MTINHQLRIFRSKTEPFSALAHDVDESFAFFKLSFSFYKNKIVPLLLLMDRSLSFLVMRPALP